MPYFSFMMPERLDPVINYLTQISYKIKGQQLEMTFTHNSDEWADTADDVTSWRNDGKGHAIRDNLKKLGYELVNETLADLGTIYPDTAVFTVPKGTDAKQVAQHLKEVCTPEGGKYTFSHDEKIMLRERKTAKLVVAKVADVLERRGVELAPDVADELLTEMRKLHVRKRSH